MNKTWIIIQREFINRVSKKSFILLTILMPFVFAALIFVPLWLSTVKGGDQKQVAVIDETMKYLPQFKDDESYHFVGVPQMEASFRTDSSTWKSRPIWPSIRKPWPFIHGRKCRTAFRGW